MRFQAALLALVLAQVSMAVIAAEGLTAFPGAEGFGTETPGGRGGKTMEVTNLNDKGPGSLAAIDAQGPRTIIFRVGGTLEVDSPLQIRHPFITIAGQTAPGGGITLKNGPANLYAPLQVKTHDVVIRYLRSRPGPGGVPPAGQDGSNVDALTIADPQNQVYNVVVDHCSFSWSVDEVVNSWYDAHDITFQWCIMSEGLHNPADRKGAGSKGPLLGGKGSERISVHHNLMVHNVGRNPMIKATGVVDLVNNIMFVPRTVAAVVDGELGACHVNLVGNNVIAPNGDGLVYGVAVLGQLPVSLFVKGNLGPHRISDDQPDQRFVSPSNGAHSRIGGRRETPAITTTSAAQAYQQVLASAGATIPMRDAADERVIADVVARHARVISDPAEVGGWPELASGDGPVDSDHDGTPDQWELQHNLDPLNPHDANGDANSDGYTNLESFLNTIDPAAPLSVQASE